MMINLHRLRVGALSLSLSLAMAGLAPLASAQPSDIDIFTAAPAAGDRPNVLFVLDSSANWNASVSNNCQFKDNGVPNGIRPEPQASKFAVEMCALYNVIDALPVASGKGPDDNALFNIGLMLINENANGGYPRRAFTPLTSNNKTVLKALFASLNNNGDKGSNADYGQTLYEAYLYFRNRTALNGSTAVKADRAAFQGNRYQSPTAGSCAGNHVILIGNGSPQNSSPENSVATLLAAAVDQEFPSWTVAARSALKSNIVNPALGNDAANWSDEMARFMRSVNPGGLEDSPGIITHAVAVRKGPSDGNFPALMNSVANYGGGRYFDATDADQLTAALLQIFNEVQAAESVFASASLPVSVSTRGSFSNQIYFGSFRPDGLGKPRWNGNLKQYRFSLDAVGALSLTDANGNGALSSSTGFFAPGAVSYWTQASTFWSGAPLGTPATGSDLPDGEVVEKGGAAQWLRRTYATGQDGRRVLTCIGCANGTVLGSSDSTRFATGNAALTSGLLGVANATERSTLIEWVRGNNNAGDPAVPVTSPATTVRSDVHGDVLHSRPAVINYGGSIGVRVFYGANDGQLRAINGNPTAQGEELWSFVPQEQLGKLKRLRDNTPAVKLSTTPDGLGAQPRDYGVDGPIGVYQKIAASGAVSRAVIYVGMRRGGRQIYAIDVTAPDAPVFLWKVTHQTAGMSLLGQTWSEPRVARVKGVDDPVLIFGGGYDAAAEDSGGAATMGRAVYVLNALTGAVVRTFTTLDGGTGGSISRSVTGDISLVDVDFDGKVDRGYAVDLSGQVYRIDFETASGVLPAQWTIYKLADLSGGTATGRKFFYGPDVVLTRDFAALMLGSGDREKPLLSATQDHFFQLFDRRKDKGAPALATPITFASLQPMGETPSINGAGCYMALEQGEKVVNAATSIGGFSYFGTNRPGSSARGQTCTPNLGIAKSYAMPLFCKAATGSPLVGGGLPPSPVAGIVTITKSDGTTSQVPFIIGAPNARNSALEGTRITPLVESPRRRRYWFQEVQR